MTSPETPQEKNQQEKSPQVDKATLEKITAAAQLQLALEKKLDDLKEEQSRVNKELAEVTGGWGYEGGKGFAIEGLIPKLLQEAGVEQIVMTGGLVVEVNPEIQCPSMAKDSDKKDVVLNWAERSGNGGVIKDFIQIPFDKGDKRLKTVLWLIERLKLVFYRERSIHSGTLKSLIKEILATPKKTREEFNSQEEYDKWMLKNDVPMDELGVGVFNRSKIVKPKEPKVKIK